MKTENLHRKTLCENGHLDIKTEYLEKICCILSESSDLDVDYDPHGFDIQVETWFDVDAAFGLNSKESTENDWFNVYVGYNNNTHNFSLSVYHDCEDMTEEYEVVFSKEQHEYFQSKLNRLCEEKGIFAQFKSGIEEE